MRLRGILATSLPLLSLCAACSAPADTSPGEPVGVSFEEIVGGTPATNYPEAAVLNIDVPANGGSYWMCSATVIAPRVVLTAGHCVDGHAKWELYVGTQYRVSTSATTYDWHENGSDQVDPKHHDIGLVFLGADVTLASYPTLATAPVAAQTKLTNVGRINNGAATSVPYEATGAVSDATPIGFPFDYQAADLIQPGDSGGPDFVAGTHVIAAVNSGAGSGSEALARVDLLAPWIAAQIAAHPGGGAAPADAGAHDAATSPVPADAGLHDAAPSPTPPVDAGSHDAAPDAAVHDAGADAAAHDAGVTPPPATQEQEPNGALAQANPILGTSMSGALASSTDVDWFTLPSPVGKTGIQLKATADATFAVGVVSGTTCTIGVSGLTGVTASTTGAPATLCMIVSSTGHKTQSYTIAVSR